MSLANLINRPCTIVRREAGLEADRYGTPIPTEVSVATVCELQQKARDEDEQAGESSDTDWTAWFLPGTDVDTSDILVVDGQSYELVGDPAAWRNPRTREVEHLEASLRRAGGARTGS